MTMDFKVADKKLLSAIKVGQAVTFGLTKEAKTGYVISRIEPAK
jgi:Cu/Ag efflux protein CusF